MTLIGLGLTAENVTQLKQGHPIHLKLRELDVDTKIELFLFYGEDEKRIYAQLKEHDFIGPETKVIGEP